MFSKERGMRCSCAEAGVIRGNDAAAKTQSVKIEINFFFRFKDNFVTFPVP
jgi:hypothetical protein